MNVLILFHQSVFAFSTFSIDMGHNEICNHFAADTLTGGHGTKFQGEGVFKIPSNFEGGCMKRVFLNGNRKHF